MPHRPGRPRAPSPGVLADNILYVSGMLPLHKSWTTVGAGDIRA